MAALKFLRGIVGTLLTLGVCFFASPLSSSAQTRPLEAEIFAAINFAPVPGDVERNKERVAKLIVEAKRQGARYIVLPELSLTGALDQSDPRKRQLQPQRLAESVPGPTTRYFGRYARELGIWLTISVLERERGGGYFLTTVLLNEHGQIISSLRKIMVRLNGKDGTQAIRGNSYLDVIDTVDDRGRRLGILSGDDIQIGVPRLAARGADTILITAGWNNQDPVKWDELSRQLSKEFSVNLVVANRLDGDIEGEGNTRKFGGIYRRSGETFHPDVTARVKGLTLAALDKRKSAWQIESELGLPSVVVPAHLPPSPEIAELGRTLFFDKSLSNNKTISCSTCHRPDRAFTNGEVKGIGVEGRTTKRNVPTLLNVAFRPLLQWDGYASSIENFVKYPISGYTEMNFHYIDDALPHVRSQAAYVEAFRSAMGIEQIEFEHIERAIATFLRTLISGNSPFDRYYYGRDKSALNDSARRGLKLFTGKAECSACHVIGDQYALFTDFKYHSLGVGYDDRHGVYTDVGLGGISTDEFSGLFQTPSLRNVAETAPYMHDGSLKTLEEVIEFYNGGGIRSPRRDAALRPLLLNEQEKKDLAAFLRSLTGNHRYSSQGHRLNYLLH